MEPLSDLTPTELKATAYDCISQMEQAQATLRQVNEELARRTYGTLAESEDLPTQELPENPDTPLVED